MEKYRKYSKEFKLQATKLVTEQILQGDINKLIKSSLEIKAEV